MFIKCIFLPYVSAQLLPYRTNVSQGRHYAMLLDILYVAILRLIFT